MSGGAGRLGGIGLGGEHSVQVVAGVGIVRLESEGFLALADRLVELAFPAEGAAEIVMRQIVVFGDRERMAKECFTVLSMPELLPRQRQAEQDCHFGFSPNNWQSTMWETHVNGCQ